MVSRARLVSAVGIVNLLGLVACGAIWGFEDLTLEPTDSGSDVRPDVIHDAMSDTVRPEATTDTGHPGDAGCVPALPPDPPVGDDESDVDATVVYALESIDLGTDGGDLIGFDLDEACTCPGPSSCNLPTTATDNQWCDRPGGRDVASAGLFAILALDSNLSENGLNADIDKGRFTFLVRMRAYNGTANDPQVTLEFFNSPGISGGGHPTWNGSDSWLVYPDNVALGEDGGITIGSFVDFHAYVTDYTLVGHINALSVRLSPDTGGNDNYLQVDTSSLVLSAPLNPDGGAIQGGMIGARVTSKSLLGSFAALQAPDDGEFYCGDAGLFSLLSRTVCAGQDIMTNPMQDNTDASCNAISFAIGFTAAPANLGPQYGPPQVPSNCPPGWNPTCGM